MIASGAKAQPSWQWARNATVAPTGLDEGESVVMDPSGDLVVTGSFAGSITFGSTVLTSAGGSDIFVVKYNSAGIVIWAKSFGGNILEHANAIDVDGSGNIYVTGIYLSTTMSFGATVLVNSNPGGQEIFFAKLDGQGDPVWAKTAGGTNFDFTYTIKVDASGNSYLGGRYRSASIIFGGYTLTKVDSYDMFLVKYDPNGNPVWAKNFGGIGDETPASINFDNTGKIIVTGYFSGSMQMDAFSFNSNGGSDIFFARLDPAGNVLLAKTFGGTGSDDANSIVCDQAGNFIICGWYYSIVFPVGSANLFNFDPTGLTADLFVAKFDNNGNALWGITAVPNGFATDNARSVAVDNQGDIYVAGNTSTQMIWGPLVISPPHPGNSDIFIAKLNASGIPVWVRMAGSAGTDQAYCILRDNTGNSYITGHHGGPQISFGFTTLTNAGSQDFFLAKLGDQVTAAQEIQFDAVWIQGNVSCKWKTVSESGIQSFELERSKDGIKFSKIGEKKPTGGLNQQTSYTWVDYHPVKNLSFYRLKEITTDGQYSYSKIVRINNPAGGLVAIFPNPASTNIKFEINASNFSDLFLLIYSANGALLKRIPITTRQTKLETGNLNSGILYYKLYRRIELLDAGSFIIQ